MPSTRSTKEFHQCVENQAYKDFSEKRLKRKKITTKTKKKIQKI